MALISNLCIIDLVPTSERAGGVVKVAGGVVKVAQEHTFLAPCIYRTFINTFLEVHNEA